MIYTYDIFCNIIALDVIMMFFSPYVFPYIFLCKEINLLGIVFTSAKYFVIYFHVIIVVT